MSASFEIRLKLEGGCSGTLYHARDLPSQFRLRCFR